MNKILQLRKKGRLYELEFPDQKLVVHEETILHFRLLKDTQLTDEQLESIKAYDGFAQGLAKAYHYLSFKPRSVAQMKAYLKEKEIGAIDRVIAELKTKGYLDDEQTARMIADQVLAQAKGKNVIRQKLVTAKIHPTLIDKVISEIQIDDSDVQRRLKKYLKPSTKSKRAFHASLMQKMMAAGFDYGLVQQAVSNNQSLIDECVDERQGIMSFVTKNASLSKDQTIKKLIAQGYDYGLIQQVLREEKHED